MWENYAKPFLERHNVAQLDMFFIHEVFNLWCADSWRPRLCGRRRRVIRRVRERPKKVKCHTIT